MGAGGGGSNQIKFFSLLLRVWHSCDTDISHTFHTHFTESTCVGCPALAGTGIGTEAGQLEFFDLVILPPAMKNDSLQIAVLPG